MTKTSIDYSKTIIYKIVCNDLNVKDLYVGHTTDFTKRKYQHKNNSINENRKHYTIQSYDFIRKNGGWCNWSMIEIEKFPCNDGNEAKARERYWVETLNSLLNSISPIRSYDELKESKKAYDKIYSKDNKIKKDEYALEYRLKNIDTINEKRKEYRKQNKEKIRNQRLEYMINNADKFKEMQSIYTIKRKDKKQEYDKDYRLKNKEEITERQRQYRIEHKEIINERKSRPYLCECGCTIKWDKKASHIKTLKHKKLCDLLLTSENKIKNVIKII